MHKHLKKPKSLISWQTSVFTMIEKDYGDPKTNQLHQIYIFKAAFSLIEQLVIAGEP